MALVKKTALLGVDDCKIFPVTEDTAGAFTCGAGLDVPGIKQISVTLEVDEKELTGDEKTLATSAKIKSVTFTSEYAQLDLDVLAALTGGAVETTDETKQTFRIGENALPAYFQLQAQVKGVDFGGDAHIVIYKAKATALPINGTESDYATYTFDGRGVFTECKFNAVDGESRLMDVTFNSTVTDLAAITYSA